MSRIIFCSYLKKEAPGLLFKPTTGEIGQRIFDNISQEAWSLWMTKQTLLINEYKYNLMNAEHRQILQNFMIDFLFNGKDITVSGYKPQ